MSDFVGWRKALNPYNVEQALAATETPVKIPKRPMPESKKTEPALVTDLGRLNELGEKMNIPETMPTPFDNWTRALKTAKTTKQELGKTPGELAPQALRYLGEAANTVAMGVPELVARNLGGEEAINKYRAENPALTQSAQIGGQIAGMAPTPTGGSAMAAAPILSKGHTTKLSPAGFGFDKINVKGKSVKVPDKARSARIEDYYKPGEIAEYKILREKGRALSKEYPGHTIENMLNKLSDQEVENIANITADPIQYEFFKSGFHNTAAPEFTVGWRYGEAPTGGRSRNFSGDTYEKGVSFMQTGTGDKSPGTFELFNAKPQAVTWHTGFELPWSGSDGEPLMVGTRKIPK